MRQWQNLALISSSTKFAIELSPSVRTTFGQIVVHLATELTSSIENSSNAAAKTHMRSHLLALYVLDSALKAISEDGRYFNFRPASRKECEAAQVSFKAEDSGTRKPIRYVFYETYGWRFTIRINMGNNKGSVLHIQRVELNNDDAIASLKAVKTSQ